MSLKSWIRGIQQKIVVNSARKMVRDFKKSGIRKVQLDENMNCYVTSEEGIFKLESFKKYAKKGNEEIRELFVRDFTSELDMLSDAHEEFVKRGVRVKSWLLY